MEKADKWVTEVSSGGGYKVSVEDAVGIATSAGNHADFNCFNLFCHMKRVLFCFAMVGNSTSIL